MVIQHKPRERFGGLDADGRLIYPNAYDCYRCHYGVTFSQTSLQNGFNRYMEVELGQPVRHIEEFRPRPGHDWSTSMSDAVSNFLRTHGEGFVVDFCCPRCGAPVVICFGWSEIHMSTPTFWPIAVLSEDGEGRGA